MVLHFPTSATGLTAAPLLSLVRTPQSHRIGRPFHVQILSHAVFRTCNPDYQICLHRAWQLISSGTPRILSRSSLLTLSPSSGRNPPKYFSVKDANYAIIQSGVLTRVQLVNTRAAVDCYRSLWRVAICLSWYDLKPTRRH